ncbi:Chitodextrinase precursor [compost metagenome]
MKTKQHIFSMLLIFYSFVPKALATDYYTTSALATLAGNTGAVNANWTTNPDGTTGLTAVTIATTDNLIILNGGIATITAGMNIGALTINTGGEIIHNNNASASSFTINGLLTWNGTIKTMQAGSGSNFFNANGNITGTTGKLDPTSNRGVYSGGTAGKTISLNMAITPGDTYGTFVGLIITKDRILAGNCLLSCPINYNQNCILDLATYSLQVPSIRGGVAGTRVLKGSATASLTLSGSGDSVIFLDPTLTTLNSLNIDDSLNPGTTSTITINGNLTANTLKFGTPTSTNTRSIQVNGNFKLANNGTMQVQARGTTAATQYSQLNVNGNITIGTLTTLKIDLINSYTPLDASQFNFALSTSGSISGSFKTPQYPIGFTGTVSYPSGNTAQCLLFLQPQYQLNWTDDFTGTQLNSTEWFHRLQGVWRDAYNDPTALTVANDNLIIQPYTDVVNGVTTHHSDEIATKRQFLYGRFEAKIAMVNAPASWSAFWIQSNTNGNPIGDPQKAGMEMDIVESLPNDGRVHSNIHWDGYGASHKSTGIITGDVGANSGNYHIYAMEWTPYYYKFYVDGNLTWTYTANISRTPEFIILSTEIENNSWAGTIPAGGYGAQGQGSTKMQVDYVKYYSLVDTPSTVSITSPADNANFNTGQDITITADATDADGEISKVEFFNGTTKLGQDLTAPYSFTWPNAMAGNYNLTAKVTDIRTGTTTSSAITVHVNGTSITYPTDNSNFPTNETITIKANANNSNGTINKVEFFKNDIKLGEDLTAPYSFDLTNVPTGNYTLTAKATDNNEVVTSSDIVNISVNPAIGLVADAFVRDGSYDTTNYGTNSVLTVKKDKSGYNREVYLKFDLNGLNSFNKALLRLNINSALTNVAATTWQVYYVPDDTWSETGITSSNKPAPGTLLATINGQSEGWAEWNITNQALAELSGDKTLSLCIVSSVVFGDSDVNFRSKENSNTALRPQLMITTDPAPTVSITSPSNNESFTTTSSVTINADAIDSNGTITKVEFFQGTTKLAEDLTAPYSFNWNNPAPGSYSITAVATDNDGVSTTSEIVTIFVNTAVTPLADTYVRDGSYATSNYGTATAFTVKKDGTSYSREAYLKFDLNGLNSFDTATLRLNITSANTGVTTTTWQIYYVPTDSWTETGITWSNKPASTTLLATINGQSSGWAEWNITDQALAELAGDKTLSLRIVSTVTSSTADASFRSKEDMNATLRPQLVLTPGSLSGKISGKNNLISKSIEPDIKNSTVQAYPNPTKDVLYINLGEHRGSEAKVFDLHGQMLLNQKLTISDTQLNLYELPTGLYLVKIFADYEELAVMKIVKK